MPRGHHDDRFRGEEKPLCHQEPGRPRQRALQDRAQPRGDPCSEFPVRRPGARLGHRLHRAAAEDLQRGLRRDEDGQHELQVQSRNKHHRSVLEQAERGGRIVHQGGGLRVVQPAGEQEQQRKKAHVQVYRLWEQCPKQRFRRQISAAQGLHQRLLLRRERSPCQRGHLGHQQQPQGAL